VSETINQYREKAAQYWTQLSRTNKIIFISVVALTILTIVLLVIHFSRTEYALAYTDLSPQDAAAIKEYLESNGIPYRFSSDGTSVGVPAKMVTNVKIDVAAQDLIQNGSQGFGLFRNNISSFGMSDNEFQLLSVDARAGELQKLISSFEGVSKAQVLLTIPEESVFINSNEPEQSLASVVVTFKPGFRPDQAMIDGMYNLIRTGVKNLTLENIKVIDQYGNLLMPSELDGLGPSSTVIEQQLRIKRMIEADIQRTIANFLGKLYGHNKVAVSVVASLNFDQVNSHVRTFTPVDTENQTGIVRSQQITERSSVSESGQAGGVAGTGTTDVPNYPGAGSGGGRSSTDEYTETINYEINEVTQSIVSSPYVVKDLTIFAGIEPPDPDDPSSLPQEQVDEIKRTLGNIVSTSLANSGQVLTPEQIEQKVSVIAQSFQGGAELEPAGGRDLAAWYYALGGAALALAAAGGYMIIRRRRQRELAMEEEAQELSQPVVEFPTLDIENMRNENQIRRQLENLARRKPEEFVNLLRTWLADE